MNTSFLCTDCIHCNEYGDEYACFRKPNKINPVDGTEIPVKPKLCRLERAELFWAWWACGKQARFFVHRNTGSMPEGFEENGSENHQIEAPEELQQNIPPQDTFQGLNPPEVPAS